MHRKFNARSHVIRITVGFCHGNYYPQKYEKSHLHHHQRHHYYFYSSDAYFHAAVAICVCWYIRFHIVFEFDTDLHFVSNHLVYPCFVHFFRSFFFNFNLGHGRCAVAKFHFSMICYFVATVVILPASSFRPLLLIPYPRRELMHNEYQSKCNWIKSKATIKKIDKTELYSYLGNAFEMNFYTFKCLESNALQSIIFPWWPFERA